MWAFRNAAEMKDSRTGVRRPAEGDPSPVIAGRKGAAVASITEAVLRREVWRDLEQLLNTISLESTVKEMAEFPLARRSILNFGLPDISRRTIDELKANDRGIEKEIEAALRAYEPRFLRNTVRVKRDTSIDPASLKVRFYIQADLVCRPVDVPVEFMADVDVSSGRFEVSGS
jgi:type VI secretion system protein ImpF